MLKLKRQIIMALLIFTISSFSIVLYSQNNISVPTRQSSLEAFSKGDYEQAYREFSELLVTYSKDPLYKYYSGVCLVKLERDPDSAISLLKQAIQGSGAIRSLPADAFFYLGRAQQFSGMYEDAIKTFNSFSDAVGKKTAKELGVTDFIQQCIAEKGAIPKNEVKVVSENILTTPVEKEIVQKPVEKIVMEKRDLPAGYEAILNEALEFQYKADSITSLVEKQKIDLDNSSSGSLASIKSKIADNEMLAISFQKAADDKYDEAQTAMNPEMVNDPLLIPGVQQEKDVVKDTISDSKEDEKQMIAEISVVDIPEETKIASDTIKKAIITEKAAEQVFSVFTLLPNPVTDPAIKISIDPEVPDGLIYRIQVAVFINPVAPVYFKGIEPIYGFKLSGSDRTVYYAGMFRRSSDAQKALTSVKKKGFNDAFVVALYGNKSVSTDRAAILEREWGTRPLFSQISKDVISADTIPPTLSFRVEVARSLKPLEADVLDQISKLAGTRGMDILSLDDDSIVYLIGKFITFESAVEYADLLVRNGYREAKVGAWLGRREIPVDIARQLFENN